MPDCSLCGNPIPQEGGTILFTDGRGLPFEVCGTCEEHVNALHQPKDEAEMNRSLEYIAGCADAAGNRTIYESLMGFIREQAPPAAVNAREKVTEEEMDIDSEVNIRKDGKRKAAVIAAIVVILTILAVIFGGFKF